MTFGMIFQEKTKKICKKDKNDYKKYEFILLIYLKNMLYKDKITISISKNLLNQIDKKIDKINFKNRSHVIENMVREGMKLRKDIGGLILAHERKWNDGEYPLDVPKILMKIDGKTLIEKHIEYLKEASIDKVVIAVGYKKQEIIDYVNKKIFGIEVEFLEVNENDLSLKIMSLAKNLLDANKILTILGDNYFYPLNLMDFIHYHNTNNSDLSIIVSMLSDVSMYGNIVLNGNNIIRFIEKPRIKEDISYIINAGIYLMDISKIPDTNKNVKIESEFFPEYVTKAKVKAYFHNGKYFHLQDNKTLKLFTK